MSQNLDELTTFLNNWVQDPNNAKKAFVDYQNLLTEDGVSFSFKSRPGISYSLRAKHVNQTSRDLFVLIDVVDDEPDNRWLSVCFYADMVEDPKELGDFVPNGLMNENACCFNLETEDAEQQSYIAERLKEALAHAKAK